MIFLPVRMSAVFFGENVEEITYLVLRFLSRFLGHYVPQLADFIFDENKNASKDKYINLKGFIVSTA